MKTILSLFLLAVVTLIHCQEHEHMIVFTLQEVLEKLEGISDTLKGHEELLQRIPDMQEKLEHLENNLQELHYELEHVKGLSQETGQCLQGDDLEHLTNVSAAAHQEIKSFVHEEISGIISLAQKDECSEGSFLCGEHGICHDTLFKYSCSCPSGFTWDGSDCIDIDECTEGKGICHPSATCKNSIGSYSCSCNKPFEGDGRTSCEFQCRSPAKVIRGLGCVKIVEEDKTFIEMEAFCQEEGGKLLQQFNKEQLKDIQKNFNVWGDRWVGVYDGKWTSDESLVPEDLWEEGYESDPSKRCGNLGWDSSFSSLIVNQVDCSGKTLSFCQFQLP